MWSRSARWQEMREPRGTTAPTSMKIVSRRHLDRTLIHLAWFRHVMDEFIVVAVWHDPPFREEFFCGYMPIPPMGMQTPETEKSAGMRSVPRGPVPRKPVSRG